MKAQDSASSPTEPLPPEILFVGDSIGFSDMYIRLIQSEFQNNCVRRLANLSEAKQFTLDKCHEVLAIVLSCRGGQAEFTRLQELSDVERSPHFVLAYQATSEVRGLLETARNRSFVERLSFLPLRARIDGTVTILRLILSGERHISGEVVDALVAAKTAEAEESWTLTAREKQVLEQLAKGASNKVIARELDLAESTVKLHIHHIISKLGVSNRTEAAVAYVAGNAKKQEAI